MGAVAGLVLASAFVAAYNTTATTPEGFIGREGLIALLLLGGLGGASLGAVFSDPDEDGPA